ncbi:snRNA-activating protein complex subunit 2-like, partial [Corapipo altera]|uniref:snRNA-activating protein complex subunit 2-like n=1 Tax=Corapipo altera TaxID=415028 RepID=UPI000FD667CB
MKPPGRPRLVPSRFAEPPQGPGSGPGSCPGRPWGQREKRALLAALREAQEGPLGSFPEALPLRALRERLPRRSEAEIRAFLVRLRGRAAREALTSKFGNILRLQRRIRAPIEVW